MTPTTMVLNTRYWICDPCLYRAWNDHGRSRRMRVSVASLDRCLCVCCSHPGGALKRTLEGEWCHLSCMMSSNVLTVLNYSNMEPIIA